MPCCQYGRPYFEVRVFKWTGERFFTTSGNKDWVLVVKNETSSAICVLRPLNFRDVKLSPPLCFLLRKCSTRGSAFLSRSCSDNNYNSYLSMMMMMMTTMGKTMTTMGKMMTIGKTMTTMGKTMTTRVPVVDPRWLRHVRRQSIVTNRYILHIILIFESCDSSLYPTTNYDTRCWVDRGWCWIALRDLSIVHVVKYRFTVCRQFAKILITISHGLRLCRNSLTSNWVPTWERTLESWDGTLLVANGFNQWHDDNPRATFFFVVLQGCAGISWGIFWCRCKNIIAWKRPLINL